MSMEKTVGSLLADMFNVATEDLVLTVEETEFSLADLIEMMIAAEDSAPVPPQRGSAAYLDTIRTVSKEEELPRVTHALACLWRDYGWRGPLDVMVQWVHQIEHAEFLPPSVRDMFGAVRIDHILLIEPGDETVLQLAADHAEEAVAEEGAAPHEAFSEGLRMSEFAFTVARQWRPVLDDAFRAEARNCQDRRGVFAALYRGPGRADGETLIQAALLLATAAAVVRNLPALADDVLQRAVTTGRMNSPWAILHQRNR
jgi:hypothetical protein